ncbi:MAG TPA: zinc-ribbon domain-containing protein, partial [Polyangiaceae bacterium]|nr:zinc-ribbon domain-containing protein [Polyangiaceae bacterium]
MNVTCSQCSAKYAISDERVRGRRVRIKCKRCSESFIVDGTELEAAGTAPDGATETDTHGPGPSDASQASTEGAPSDLWMVALTDDNTQEMELAQVIDAYTAGTIDQYSYIWREGMSDWLTPFDIPEIAEPLTARGFQRVSEDLAAPSAGGDQVV